VDDYKKIADLKNLQRAYRWVITHPDRSYMNLSEDSFAAYALSLNDNLKNLRQQLDRSLYQPSHASKRFLPKPSGLLRCVTLLTVEDQIVYQACANIIAEKLHRKVKRRYRNSVFHHLYAGKNSKYFYLNWKESYRLYSRAVVQKIQCGHNWVANFDLSSFYDSIDHHVLHTFLRHLKIEEGFIAFFLSLLKHWTSTTWASNISQSGIDVIYMGHGIPQGPVSSGIISEIVLEYIDTFGLRSKNIEYLRYVDDIKLFGRSDTNVREGLISGIPSFYTLLCLRNSSA
jgi:retron-type reverse transcriptase